MHNVFSSNKTRIIACKKMGNICNIILEIHKTGRDTRIVRHSENDAQGMIYFLNSRWKSKEKRQSYLHIRQGR